MLAEQGRAGLGAWPFLRSQRSMVGLEREHAFTLDTYTSALPALDKSAAEVMADLSLVTD